MELLYATEVFDVRRANTNKTGSVHNFLYDGDDDEDDTIIFGFCFFFVNPGGKRSEELILPINDSISGTLSTDEVDSVALDCCTGSTAFGMRPSRDTHLCNTNARIVCCSCVRKQQLQLIQNSRKIKCG